MTINAIGQKLDQLLTLCKTHFHKLDHLERLLGRQDPNDGETHDENEKSEGNGTSSAHALRGGSPDHRHASNPNDKQSFWKRPDTANKIQLSLALTTLLAVISGVSSNLQTRALVNTAQATYEASARPYIE